MSSSLSVRVASFVGSCLFLAILCGSLRADDPQPTKTKAAVRKVKDDEVKALVKQLGSKNDNERAAAVNKLRAAGLEVIPELGDAIPSGSARTKESAIEILSEHLKSTDPETRMAAYAELRKIATGQRSTTSANVASIIKEYPEVRAEFEANLKARRTERLAQEAAGKTASTNKTPSPKTKPGSQPAAEDSLTKLRRQAFEQQLKDGELAIDKIKKQKLPKDLEAQQISAINQGLQSVRAQLQALDRPARKK